MTELSSEVLQAQITQLEQQLAAKRAESGADAAAPYERAEVHVAVGEQIRAQMPVAATPSPTVSSGGTGKSWQDPALAPTVQQLVNVAFTQSLAAAVAQAVRTGNAALIDAFHDVLADELHKELLNRQKLAPAA
jgi:hypothetical protein